MNEIICTVDVVFLTLSKGELHVALLKRDHAPFEGALALPGGYIHADTDDDTQDSAMRMLKDKTGIVSPYLEQLGTFSGRGRDPRGWSISVAYYALVPPALLLDSNATSVLLRPVSQLKSLPFDHLRIIETAVKRVRDKSAYSSLPVYLCNETFTMLELQRVYEAVLGGPINRVTFKRKMDELAVLEPINQVQETGGAHRPSQLFRMKPALSCALQLSDKAITTGS